MYRDKVSNHIWDDHDSYDDGVRLASGVWKPISYATAIHLWDLDLLWESTITNTLGVLS